MCTNLGEDEIHLVFCKIGDKIENLFKVDEQEVLFVSYNRIVEMLKTPNLILEGQRMFYSFNKAVDFFEQA